MQPRSRSVVTRAGRSAGQPSREGNPWMNQNQNLILIAEDDADIRDMLTFALESAGYRTVAAKDGHIAARILTVAKPVGLITDVRMPAMNGMELCQLARRTPAIKDTAILMISANAHA